MDTKVTYLNLKPQNIPYCLCLEKSFFKKYFDISMKEIIIIQSLIDMFGFIYKRKQKGKLNPYRTGDLKSSPTLIAHHPFRLGRKKCSTQYVF